jgi:hypothetical protein
MINQRRRKLSKASNQECIITDAAGFLACLEATSGQPD